MHSSTPVTFNGLHHLRAFAILFVFLFHYFILSGGQPTWLPELAKFGWTGVDLFFVLSGFLISSQLFSQIKQGQKISLKQFFLKRFFRIIPAYLLTLLIYFCVPFFREKESLPAIWKFLTFTQNFGLNLKDQGTFSHAWSLCVEEHFYLLLPLILLLLQMTRLTKKSYRILLLLFAAGLICRMVSFEYFYSPNLESTQSWMYWYKYIYYPSYNRLDGLLAGVSIAAIYQFMPVFWNKISAYGNQFILMGILLLTGAWFLYEDQTTFSASIFGFPLIAVGYGCIVLGAVCPSSILFRCKSGLTRLIAVLSYAIYLTHKGVIHMTHHLLEDAHLNPNTMLVICMINCIVAGYLMHLLVEKPFMNLRKKILNSNRGQVTSVKKKGPYYSPDTDK